MREWFQPYEISFPTMFQVSKRQNNSDPLEILNRNHIILRFPKLSHRSLTTDLTSSLGLSKIRNEDYNIDHPPFAQLLP